MFDDEIRIVSEEGEEIDEGRVVASPVPEDQEELPEDFEELPADQVVPEIVPTTQEAPTERIVPIVLEGDDILEEPQKTTAKKSSPAEQEGSPLPVRKKAKADLLEDIRRNCQQSVEVYEESSSSTFGRQQSITSSTQVIESSTFTSSSSTVGAQKVERQVEITQADSQSVYSDQSVVQIVDQASQSQLRKKSRLIEVRFSSFFLRFRS